MNAVLSAPSKTFLLGEYLALDGGPSILLTTTPRFSLEIKPLKKAKSRFFPGKATAKPPFAPLSPAGRLLAKLAAERTADALGFEFCDPHHGKGGLGASSAQFALAYAWANGLQTHLDFDWASLLSEYRACAWSGEGSAPSGADVVAQVCGGVCWFDGREMKAEKLAWSFSSLSFTLLRTGVKLATHEHLKKMQTIPNGVLRECVALGKKAFLERDEASLVLAVERCGNVLAEAGLTATATLGLIRALRGQANGVRAVKGCGAMGADVIAVLHDRDAAEEIARWAESKGLEICGRDVDIAADGLRIE